MTHRLIDSRLFFSVDVPASWTTSLTMPSPSLFGVLWRSAASGRVFAHLLARQTPSGVALVGGGIFVCVSFAAALAQPVPPSLQFEQNIRPLLKQYCFPCHSTEKHKGDFDM